jgi:hypothetical protein
MNVKNEAKFSRIYLFQNTHHDKIGTRSENREIDDNDSLPIFPNFPFIFQDRKKKKKEKKLAWTCINDVLRIALSIFFQNVCIEKRLGSKFCVSSLYNRYGLIFKSVSRLSKHFYQKETGSDICFITYIT